MLNLIEVVTYNPIRSNYDKYKNGKQLHLSGFPSPLDRTINDPMYFLTSDASLKFLKQIAAHYDYDPVVSAAAVTTELLTELLRYAQSLGWHTVYVSGGMLALEAKMLINGQPAGPVYPGTNRRFVTYHDLSATLVGDDVCNVCKVIDLRALVGTSDFIAGHVNPKINGIDMSCPMTHNARVMQYKDDVGHFVDFNLENGNLEYALPVGLGVEFSVDVIIEKPAE